MNSPLVQDYLKTHSLAQLNAEYGINSSWKQDLPTNYKFSLNYDQIESKAGALTNQCRGLILATYDGRVLSSLNEVVGETVILARPMDRFFNHGDPNGAEVNFEHPDTCFFEKLDGTLCILYFDIFKRQWHVATRAVTEANLPIDGFDNLTFRGLFERALFDTFTARGYEGFNDTNVFLVYTDSLDRANTYCFELTTPENRIVVEYKERRLHLLGLRDTQLGTSSHGAGMFGQDTTHPPYRGLPLVKRHSFKTVNDLVEYVNAQNPTQHEGVVVCDKNFNRLKVKNVAYMAYNRARDIVGKSPRALLELILLEKIDDVLPLLPEHIKERATEMGNSLVDFIHQTDQNYAECKVVADKDLVNPRKAFCLHAQSMKFWLDPLVNRFLGRNTSAKDYILGHKNPNGSFSDSFLENILTQLKNF
jgi:RNA ligase